MRSSILQYTYFSTHVAFSPKQKFYNTKIFKIEIIAAVTVLNRCLTFPLNSRESKDYFHNSRDELLNITTYMNSMFKLKYITICIQARI